MAENAEPISMVEALEFSRRVEDQNKKLHLIQPSLAAKMGMGVLEDCGKAIGEAISDKQSQESPEASLANNKIEQVTTSYKNLRSSLFTPAKDTTVLTEENEEKKEYRP